MQQDKAIIKCEYAMAAFSTGAFAALHFVPEYMLGRLDGCS